MSRRKTERLLNLVICLLATGRHLTAEQIRAAVPGYPEQPEAFKRMFERDKEELRELGIPLELGGGDPWEDEVGYRIPRSAYELPDISIEPDEAAVLGLAARVWQQAGLADAASGALLKLRAAGIATESATPPGIEPRVDTADPAFPGLWAAVRDRRPVAFDYQAPGRPAPQRRRLEPWGVVSRRGQWYVAGFDRDRGAERVFKLSRIVGAVAFAGRPGSVEVPADADVREIVGGWRIERNRVARLRVRQGAAQGLRRFAKASGEGGDGWDVIEYSFHDTEWLASHVAGFADDVEVLAPPDVRAAVIVRLREGLAGTAEPGAAGSRTGESGAPAMTGEARRR
ncbi:MAG: WYL domain-containing protein [Streptosporangiales bacterium]|nr:WYL domain-containing protein [Streptosporangiales bacterium]